MFRQNTDLKAWRVALGLTQQEIAARLKCSQMMVSLIERGAHPKSKFVQPFARVLVNEERARA